MSPFRLVPKFPNFREAAPPLASARSGIVSAPPAIALTRQSQLRCCAPCIEVAEEATSACGVRSQSRDKVIASKDCMRPPVSATPGAWHRRRRRAGHDADNLAVDDPDSFTVRPVKRDIHAIAAPHRSECLSGPSGRRSRRP
jgi:hypothetical protein